MFNKKFIWGAATAAPQIEGGYQEGDRTPSVWDVASGYNYIFNKDTTFVTCDHYHHIEEDVMLMKKIGLKAYRFSISWTRLIPDGYGKVSKQGVEFYNKLINELVKNGIEPYVTIFHWDYPQSLLEKGGWLNPESITWFENYATECVKLFSDRVKHFITFNEPECFINLGYTGKAGAPYYDLPFEVLFKMQHNVLKANGAAILSMRKHAKDIKIGFTFAQNGRIPVSNSKEDVQAAYDAFFDNSGDGFWGNWFLNTIMTGKYDDIKLKNIKGSISYTEEDMKLIKQDLDFIGVNQYSGLYVKANKEKGYEIVKNNPNMDYTAMGWEVLPECMYWTCKMIHEKYKLPMYITENGVALTEWPDLDGNIEDNGRIKYIHDHLLQVEKAAKEGADIRGYFYWSLMDNFEWHHGNSKRFGLIRVNFDTGERLLKKSAFWYKDLIEKSSK